MNGVNYSKKSIISFFAIVIVLSAIVEGWMIAGGPDLLVFGLMWIPTLASAVALHSIRKDEKIPFSIKQVFADAGFRKCKLRYVFMGWLIPLIYLGIPYLIYWIIYPDNFCYKGTSLGIMLKDCLPVMVIGVFISLLSAIGEEIGWRGFEVPALNQRLGLHKMLFISSLFWCAWHLPILIGAGYMEGTPVWYKIPAFILCIFPVGVMTAILTLESKSVWPAAFLHAAHNNYDQAVLGIITLGDNKMYFVSETGILTIIFAWILAGICYFRYIKKAKM